MRKTTGIAFVLLCSAGCSRTEQSEKTRQIDSPPVVAVAVAARQDLSRNEVLSAEFRPFQEIDVHAKVAGYIKKIYVDVGDHVKAGQTLAVLEIPEMADELTLATAGRSRSTAQVQEQKEELGRAQAAHEGAHLVYQRLADVIKAQPKLVAQQEVDDARAKDQVAEAAVSAAKAALAAAEQQVAVSQANVSKTTTMNAYAQITAPFAGVITKRYADTGAMIPAGTTSSSNAMPVVKLAEISLLRLILPVPESVVPHIRVGERVQVRVNALGRTFEGKVSRFASSVALATRTMETEVDVPNPGQTLVPGMYAEAVLTLERRAGALTVPLQAVNAGTVYLVDAAHRIESRAVKVGIETPDQAEILEGLNPGDLVVVAGRGELRPGQTVQPKVTGGAPVKEQ
jgi:RND family efflux transporter MFP subunit